MALATREAVSAIAARDAGQVAVGAQRSRDGAALHDLELVLAHDARLGARMGRKCEQSRREKRSGAEFTNRVHVELRELPDVGED